MAVAPLLRPLEITDLRLADLSSLSDLLAVEERVWSEELRWDFRPSAELLLKNIEVGVVPGYAAVAGKELVGYSFFVQEGPKGLLGGLYVLPEAPDDTGTSLLIHSLDTLSHTPGVRRIEAQLIHSEGMPVRATFEQRAFDVFPRLFLYCDLDGLPATPEEQPVAGDDITLAPWKNDFGALARLIADCYRGHVDSRLNDQYATVKGARRFLHNIVTLPGCGVFLPAGSHCAVGSGTGDWRGVVMSSEVMKGVAHITQICVAPEFRGRGLGRALLLEALTRLRQEGFRGVSLTVTESNHRALQLYQEFGFKTVRKFDAYSRDL